MSIYSRILAGKAFVEISADSKKLSAGLNQAQQDLKKFRRAAALSMAAFSIPVKNAFDLFSKFDDSMRIIASTTGNVMKPAAHGINSINAELVRSNKTIEESIKDMRSLENTARELGRTTSYTAKQAADAMIVLARAGKSVAEINAMTESVLNLARATGTSTTESANIAIGVLNSFEVKINDVKRSIDMLTATANSSPQTLSNIGAAMRYIGPVANSMNITLEETLRDLSILANFSLKGEQAGTALRNMYVRMASAANQVKIKEVFDVDLTDSFGNLRKLDDVLVDIKRSVDANNISMAKTANTLKDVFSIRSLPAAYAMIDGIETVRDGLNRVTNQSKNAAQQMDQGVGGGVRFLKSRIQEFGIAFIKNFEKPIRKTLDAFTDIADVGISLTKSLKPVADVLGVIAVPLVKLGAAVATFKVLQFAFGGITSAAKVYNETVKSSWEKTQQFFGFKPKPRKQQQEQINVSRIDAAREATRYLAENLRTASDQANRAIVRFNKMGQSFDKVAETSKKLKKEIADFNLLLKEFAASAGASSTSSKNFAKSATTSKNNIQQLNRALNTLKSRASGISHNVLMISKRVERLVESLNKSKTSIYDFGIYIENLYSSCRDLNRSVYALGDNIKRISSILGKSSGNFRNIKNVFKNLDSYILRISNSFDSIFRSVKKLYLNLEEVKNIFIEINAVAKPLSDTMDELAYSFRLVTRYTNSMKKGLKDQNKILDEYIKKAVKLGDVYKQIVQDVLNSNAKLSVTVNAPKPPAPSKNNGTPNPGKPKKISKVDLTADEIKLYAEYLKLLYQELGNFSNLVKQFNRQAGIFVRILNSIEKFAKRSDTTADRIKNLTKVFNELKKFSLNDFKIIQAFSNGFRHISTSVSIVRDEINDFNKSINSVYKNALRFENNSLGGKGLRGFSKRLKDFKGNIDYIITNEPKFTKALYNISVAFEHLSNNSEKFYRAIGGARTAFAAISGDVKRGGGGFFGFGGPTNPKRPPRDPNGPNGGGGGSYSRRKRTQKNYSYDQQRIATERDNFIEDNKVNGVFVPVVGDTRKKQRYVSPDLPEEVLKQQKQMRRQEFYSGNSEAYKKWKENSAKKQEIKDNKERTRLSGIADRARMRFENAQHAYEQREKELQSNIQSADQNVNRTSVDFGDAEKDLNDFYKYRQEVIDRFLNKQKQELDTFYANKTDPYVEYMKDVEAKDIVKKIEEEARKQRAEKEDAENKKAFKELEDNRIGVDEFRKKVDYDREIAKQKQDAIEKGKKNKNKSGTPTQAPAQTPQAPVQTPQAPVQTPQAPVQTPQAPTQTPQAPVQTPQAPTQTPMPVSIPASTPVASTPASTLVAPTPVAPAPTPTSTSASTSTPSSDITEKDFNFGNTDDIVTLSFLRSKPKEKFEKYATMLFGDDEEKKRTFIEKLTKNRNHHPDYNSADEDEILLINSVLGYDLLSEAGKYSIDLKYRAARNYLYPTNYSRYAFSEEEFRKTLLLSSGAYGFTDDVTTKNRNSKKVTLMRFVKFYEDMLKKKDEEEYQNFDDSILDKEGDISEDDLVSLFGVKKTNFDELSRDKRFEKYRSGTISDVMFLLFGEKENTYSGNIVDEYNERHERSKTHIDNLISELASLRVLIEEKTREISEEKKSSSGKEVEFTEDMFNDTERERIEELRGGIKELKKQLKRVDKNKDYSKREKKELKEDIELQIDNLKKEGKKIKDIAVKRVNNKKTEEKSEKELYLDLLKRREMEIVSFIEKETESMDVEKIKFEKILSSLPKGDENEIKKYISKHRIAEACEKINNGYYNRLIEGNLSREELVEENTRDYNKIWKELFYDITHGGDYSLEEIAYIMKNGESDRDSAPDDDIRTSLKNMGAEDAEIENIMQRLLNNEIKKPKSKGITWKKTREELRKKILKASPAEASFLVLKDLEDQLVHELDFYGYDSSDLALSVYSSDNVPENVYSIVKNLIKTRDKLIDLKDIEETQGLSEGGLLYIKDKDAKDAYKLARIFNDDIYDDIQEPDLGQATDEELDSGKISDEENKKLFKFINGKTRELDVDKLKEPVTPKTYSDIHDLDGDWYGGIDMTQESTDITSGLTKTDSTKALLTETVPTKYEIKRNPNRTVDLEIEKQRKENQSEKTQENIQKSRGLLGAIRDRVKNKEQPQQSQNTPKPEPTPEPKPEPTPEPKPEPTPEPRSSFPGLKPATGVIKPESEKKSAAQSLAPKPEPVSSNKTKTENVEHNVDISFGTVPKAYSSAPAGTLEKSEKRNNFRETDYIDPNKSNFIDAYKNRYQKLLPLLSDSINESPNANQYLIKDLNTHLGMFDASVQMLVKNGVYINEETKKFITEVYDRYNFIIDFYKDKFTGLVNYTNPLNSLGVEKITESEKAVSEEVSEAASEPEVANKNSSTEFKVPELKPASGIAKPGNELKINSKLPSSTNEKQDFSFEGLITNFDKTNELSEAYNELQKVSQNRLNMNDSSSSESDINKANTLVENAMEKFDNLMRILEINEYEETSEVSDEAITFIEDLYAQYDLIRNARKNLKIRRIKGVESNFYSYGSYKKLLPELSEKKAHEIDDYQAKTKPVDSDSKIKEVYDLEHKINDLASKLNFRGYEISDNDDVNYKEFGYNSVNGISGTRYLFDRMRQSGVSEVNKRTDEAVEVMVHKEDIPFMIPKKTTKKDRLINNLSYVCDEKTRRTWNFYEQQWFDLANKGFIETLKEIERLQKLRQELINSINADSNVSGENDIVVSDIKTTEDVSGKTKEIIESEEKELDETKKLVENIENSENTIQGGNTIGEQDNKKQRLEEANALEAEIQKLTSNLGFHSFSISRTGEISYKREKYNKVNGLKGLKNKFNNAKTRGTDETSREKQFNKQIELRNKLANVVDSEGNVYSLYDQSHFEESNKDFLETVSKIEELQKRRQEILDSLSQQDKKEANTVNIDNIDSRYYGTRNEEEKQQPAETAAPMTALLASLPPEAAAAISGAQVPGSGKFAQKTEQATQVAEPDLSKNVFAQYAAQLDEEEKQQPAETAAPATDFSDFLPPEIAAEIAKVKVPDSGEFTKKPEQATQVAAPEQATQVAEPDLSKNVFAQYAAQLDEEEKQQPAETAAPKNKPNSESKEEPKQKLAKETKQEKQSQQTKSVKTYKELNDEFVKTKQNTKEYLDELLNINQSQNPGLFEETKQKLRLSVQHLKECVASLNAIVPFPEEIKKEINGIIEDYSSLINESSEAINFTETEISSGKTETKQEQRSASSVSKRNTMQLEDVASNLFKGFGRPSLSSAYGYTDNLTGKRIDIRSFDEDESRLGIGTSLFQDENGIINYAKDSKSGRGKYLGDFSVPVYDLFGNIKKDSKKARVRKLLKGASFHSLFENDKGEISTRLQDQAEDVIYTSLSSFVSSKNLAPVQNDTQAEEEKKAQERAQKEAQKKAEEEKKAQERAQKEAQKRNKTNITDISESILTNAFDHPGINSVSGYANAWFGTRHSSLADLGTFPINVGLGTSVFRSEDGSLNIAKDKDSGIGTYIGDFSLSLFDLLGDIKESTKEKKVKGLINSKYSLKSLFEHQTGKNAGKINQAMFERAKKIIAEKLALFVENPESYNGRDKSKKRFEEVEKIIDSGNNSNSKQNVPSENSENKESVVDTEEKFDLNEDYTVEDIYSLVIKFSSVIADTKSNHKQKYQALNALQYLSKLKKELEQRNKYNTQNQDSLSIEDYVAKATALKDSPSFALGEKGILEINKIASDVKNKFGYKKLRLFLDKIGISRTDNGVKDEELLKYFNKVLGFIRKIRYKEIKENFSVIQKKPFGEYGIKSLLGPALIGGGLGLASLLNGDTSGLDFATAAFPFAMAPVAGLKGGLKGAFKVPSGIFKKLFRNTKGFFVNLKNNISYRRYSEQFGFNKKARTNSDFIFKQEGSNKKSREYFEFYHNEFNDFISKLLSGNADQKLVDLIKTEGLDKGLDLYLSQYNVNGEKYKGYNVFLRKKAENFGLQDSKHNLAAYEAYKGLIPNILNKKREQLYSVYGIDENTGNYNGDYTIETKRNKTKKTVSSERTRTVDSWFKDEELRPWRPVDQEKEFDLNLPEQEKEFDLNLPDQEKEFDLNLPDQEKEFDLNLPDQEKEFDLNLPDQEKSDQSSISNSFEKPLKNKESTTSKWYSLFNRFIKEDRLSVNDGRFIDNILNFSTLDDLIVFNYKKGNLTQGEAIELINFAKNKRLSSERYSNIADKNYKKSIQDILGNVEFNMSPKNEGSPEEESFEEVFNGSDQSENSESRENKDIVFDDVFEEHSKQEQKEIKPKPVETPKPAETPKPVEQTDYDLGQADDEELDSNKLSPEQQAALSKEDKIRSVKDPLQQQAYRIYLDESEKTKQVLKNQPVYDPDMDVKEWAELTRDYYKRESRRLRTVIESLPEGKFKEDLKNIFNQLQDKVDQFRDFIPEAEKIDRDRRSREKRFEYTKQAKEEAEKQYTDALNAGVDDEELNKLGKIRDQRREAFETANKNKQELEDKFGARSNKSSDELKKEHDLAVVNEEEAKKKFRQARHAKDTDVRPYRELLDIAELEYHEREAEFLRNGSKDSTARDNAKKNFDSAKQTYEDKVKEADSKYHVDYYRDQYETRQRETKSAERKYRYKYEEEQKQKKNGPNGPNIHDDWLKAKLSMEEARSELRKYQNYKVGDEIEIAGKKQVLTKEEKDNLVKNWDKEVRRRTSRFRKVQKPESIDSFASSTRVVPVKDQNGNTIGIGARDKSGNSVLSRADKGYKNTFEGNIGDIEKVYSPSKGNFYDREKDAADKQNLGYTAIKERLAGFAKEKQNNERNYNEKVNLIKRSGLDSSTERKLLDEEKRIYEARQKELTRLEKQYLKTQQDGVRKYRDSIEKNSARAFKVVMDETKRQLDARKNEIANQVIKDSKSGMLNRVSLTDEISNREKSDQEFQDLQRKYREQRKDYIAVARGGYEAQIMQEYSQAKQRQQTAHGNLGRTDEFIAQTIRDKENLQQTRNSLIGSRSGVENERKINASNLSDLRKKLDIETNSLIELQGEEADAKKQEIEGLKHDIEARENLEKQFTESLKNINDQLLNLDSALARLQDTEEYLNQQSEADSNEANEADKEVSEKEELMESLGIKDLVNSQNKSQMVANARSSRDNAVDELKNTLNGVKQQIAALPMIIRKPVEGALKIFKKVGNGFATVMKTMGNVVKNVTTRIPLLNTALKFFGKSSLVTTASLMAQTLATHALNFAVKGLVGFIAQIGSMTFMSVVMGTVMKVTEYLTQAGAWVWNREKRLFSEEAREEHEKEVRSKVEENESEARDEYQKKTEERKESETGINRLVELASKKNKTREDLNEALEIQDNLRANGFINQNEYAARVDFQTKSIVLNKHVLDQTTENTRESAKDANSEFLNKQIKSLKMYADNYKQDGKSKEDFNKQINLIMETVNNAKANGQEIDENVKSRLIGIMSSDWAGRNISEDMRGNIQAVIDSIDKDKGYVGVYDSREQSGEIFKAIEESGIKDKLSVYGFNLEDEFGIGTIEGLINARDGLLNTLTKQLNEAEEYIKYATDEAEKSRTQDNINVLKKSIEQLHNSSSQFIQTESGRIWDSINGGFGKQYYEIQDQFLASVHNIESEAKGLYLRNSGLDNQKNDIQNKITQVETELQNPNISNKRRAELQNTLGMLKGRMASIDQQVEIGSKRYSEPLIQNAKALRTEQYYRTLGGLKSGFATGIEAIDLQSDQQLAGKEDSIRSFYAMRSNDLEMEKADIEGKKNALSLNLISEEDYMNSLERAKNGVNIDEVNAEYDAKEKAKMKEFSGVEREIKEKFNEEHKNDFSNYSMAPLYEEIEKAREKFFAPLKKEREEAIERAKEEQANAKSTDIKAGLERIRSENAKRTQEYNDQVNQYNDELFRINNESAKNTNEMLEDLVRVQNEAYKNAMLERMKYIAGIKNGNSAYKMMNQFTFDESQYEIASLENENTYGEGGKIETETKKQIENIQEKIKDYQDQLNTEKGKLIADDINHWIADLQKEQAELEGILNDLPATYESSQRILDNYKIKQDLDKEAYKVSQEFRSAFNKADEDFYYDLFKAGIKEEDVIRDKEGNFSFVNPDSMTDEQKEMFGYAERARQIRMKNANDNAIDSLDMTDDVNGTVAEMLNSAISGLGDKEYGIITEFNKKRDDLKKKIQDKKVEIIRNSEYDNAEKAVLINDLDKAYNEAVKLLENKSKFNQSVFGYDIDLGFKNIADTMTFVLVEEQENLNKMIKKFNVAAEDIIYDANGAIVGIKNNKQAFEAGSIINANKETKEKTSAYDFYKERQDFELEHGNYDNGTAQAIMEQDQAAAQVSAMASYWSVMGNDNMTRMLEIKQKEIELTKSQIVYNQKLNSLDIKRVQLNEALANYQEAMTNGSSVEMQQEAFKRYKEAYEDFNNTNSEALEAYKNVWDKKKEANEAMNDQEDISTNTETRNKGTFNAWEAVSERNTAMLTAIRRSNDYLRDIRTNTESLADGYIL